MEYIGGISEFNYSPIQDFNKALKENDAFQIQNDPEKSFDDSFEIIPILHKNRPVSIRTKMISI